MKRTMLPVLAFVLAFLCATSAWAETATPLKLPDMPLVEEKVELSILTRRYDGAESYDKMWFWKWMEAFTGIIPKVTEYDNQVFPEKANLLFASGSIPDVMLYVGNYLTNARVVEYGMTEGLLMPLNDLIENHAPNIKAVFDAYPELRTMSTCVDGNIYTLPSYGTEIYNTTRSFINKRWLDNLNLEVPTTIEELYDVLVAFKEQDANGNGDASDEIPLGGAWDIPGSQTTGALFLTAFGLCVTNESQMYLDDGVVKLAGYENNYFEYLRFVNKMYENGLLDEDIFTQNRTASRAKTNNDLVGCAADDSTMYLSGSEDTMHNWIGLGALTSAVNDKRMWPGAETANPGRFAISKTCSNPIAAIKLADMFFTQEASVFFQWGAQKGSKEALGYEGWYLDENGSFAFDFPEGYDSSWVYRLSIILPMASKVGSSEYFDACPNVYGFDFVLDKGGIHFRKEMDRYLGYRQERLPQVYLTAEQTDRQSEIVSVLDTYMASMEKKFITGAEQLTEESFEAYRQTLRDLGVEEYIQMHQEAYNAMTGA